MTRVETAAHLQPVASLEEALRSYVLKTFPSTLKKEWKRRKKGKGKKKWERGRKKREGGRNKMHREGRAVFLKLLGKVSNSVMS